jgi:hypothetical protein
MVSSIYTPNKRIGYYRDLSRALMPKQISAYNPNNPNPYAQTASTNLANVLSGLVQTYSAQKQLGKAEQLEAEQLAAQQAIGGRLAQMRTPGTGSTLDVRDLTVPPSQGYRQQQVRRRPFSVDAPQFTPEQMAAAGTTPELLQGRIAEITAGRKEAYTARQRKQLEAGLVEALRSPDPASRALARQYQTLLDPTAVALREVEEREVRKRRELSQRGAASYKISWAIDRKTKKLVPVSDLERKENPERYAPVPETTDLGPIPAWVGKTYNALDEQAALAQRGLSINANMNRLVTTGGLTTGAMQPFFTHIKAVMADFGFQFGPDLNAAQVLDAMSSGKALDVRNPKSGQGLPGATSDRDLDFLMKIVPGLAKTNFANEALLIIDTALTRRKLASVKLKMDWVSKNPHKGLIGYVSGEADKALQKIDLFTKDEKKRLDAILKSPQVNKVVAGNITTATKTWKSPDVDD